MTLFFIFLVIITIVFFIFNNDFRESPLERVFLSAAIGLLLSGVLNVLIGFFISSPSNYKSVLVNEVTITSLNAEDTTFNIGLGEYNGKKSYFFRINESNDIHHIDINDLSVTDDTNGVLYTYKGYLINKWLKHLSVIISDSSSEHIELAVPKNTIIKPFNIK